MGWHMKGGGRKRGSRPTQVARSKVATESGSRRYRELALLMPPGRDCSRQAEREGFWGGFSGWFNPRPHLSGFSETAQQENSIGF